MIFKLPSVFNSIISLLLISHVCSQPDWGWSESPVWEDDFDLPTLDLTKWSYEINCFGGGNAEQQCYVNDSANVFTSNGILHLHPIYIPSGYTGAVEGCTNNFQNSCNWTQPCTSGRIRTRFTQSWLYGKFEIRARVPSGNFLWPAIWMLPTDAVYGGWAASGEIDILETQSQFRNIFFQTIHYSPYPTNDLTGFVGNSTLDLTSAFHVYGLQWTHEMLQWSIDGNVTFSANLNRSFYSGIGDNPYTANYQPFDQQFYLILNLAVAGTFFGPAITTFNPATDSLTWSDFLIDYVKVYQPVPPPTSTSLPPDVPSNAGVTTIVAATIVALIVVLVIVVIIVCLNRRGKQTETV